MVERDEQWRDGNLPIREEYCENGGAKAKEWFEGYKDSNIKAGEKPPRDLLQRTEYYADGRISAKVYRAHVEHGEAYDAEPCDKYTDYREAYRKDGSVKSKERFEHHTNFKHLTATSSKVCRYLEKYRQDGSVKNKEWYENGKLLKRE